MQPLSLFSSRTFLLTRKEAPYPLSNHFPFPPSQHTLATTKLLSIYLPILDINRIVQYVAFCAWLLPLNSVCKVHSHCSIYQYFVPSAAAKSLQSCPTLCDPRDSSPPGSPVLGILQARTLEQVAISFSNAWKWKVKVKSLSCVWLLVTPWTAAHQAPPYNILFCGYTAFCLSIH